MAQHAELWAIIDHLQKKVARLEDEKQEILETTIKVCTAVGLPEDSPVLCRLVLQLNTLKRQSEREKALHKTRLSARASDMEVSVEVKQEPSTTSPVPQPLVSLASPLEDFSGSCQQLRTAEPNDEALSGDTKSEGMFSIETAESDSDSDASNADLNPDVISKHDDTEESSPETVVEDNTASDSDVPCSSADLQPQSDQECSDTKQTTCRNCGAKFSDLIELKLHSEMHHVRKCFYCCTCSDKFRFKYELVRHYQSTENDCTSPINCSHCALPFVTDNERRRHEIVHTGQRFACSYCTVHLTTFRALQRHEATHTGERRYICRTCSKRFGSKAQLEDHERLHTNELPFMCPTCSAAFRTKKQVSKHQSKHHPTDPEGSDSPAAEADLNSDYISKHDNMEESSPETVADDNSAPDSDMPCSSADLQPQSDQTYSDTKQTICTKCGAKFSDLSELRLHSEMHQFRTFFYCGTCNAKFRFKYALLRHYQSTENECTSPINCSQCALPFATDNERRRHEIVHTGQRFACSHCTVHLTTFRALLRHEATHTGERRYICTTCGKGFGSKIQLEDHERLHTNELPFLCLTCGAAFRTKQQVKAHQDKHHPTYPEAFVCELCGKQMISKVALSYHTRYHKLKRSLPCGDCDKTFRTSSALKQHRRSHTGERPFACSICPARFKQKCTLQSHEAFHTNKRPFPCSQCSLRFVTKSDLVRHERIHAGIKPFACEFCDLRFCEKGNLTKHVKRKHPYTLPY